MKSNTPNTFDRQTLFEWSRSIFISDIDHHLWWRTVHPMLKEQTPWDTTSTGEGVLAVRNILVALKYGGTV